MSPRALIIIAVGSLLVGSPSFAISRVGSCGITDPLEGFTVATVPAAFREISLISDSGVEIASAVPSIELTQISVQNRILIYPLRSEYPEVLDLLDRKQFVAHFLSMGAPWIQWSNANPCIEVLTVTNGSLRTTLAAWGGGRGLVFQSTVNSPDEKALSETLQSISLNPGACGW